MSTCDSEPAATGGPESVVWVRTPDGTRLPATIVIELHPLKVPPVTSLDDLRGPGLDDEEFAAFRAALMAGRSGYDDQGQPLDT